ncbi:MAG: flagellar hook-basal body complex protein FliE [Cyanobacteriota bacterium]
MDTSFIPKIDNANLISNPKIDMFTSQPVRLSAIKPNTDDKSFSEVMFNILKEFDDESKKPDKLVAESLVNPNIDIHDVAIAINQAELTLTIATQISTKLIQGYEKIISMQV